MNINPQLSRLRGELDHIDDQLLHLIEQRLSLCSAIRKSKQGDRSLFLQPERQKALLKRLEEQASVAPRAAIRHIWRELVAHSLQQQARLLFMIVETEAGDRILRLLREKYGSAAPVDWCNSVETALARAANEELVAVVPTGLNLPLSGEMTAFDCLRDENDEPHALLIGRVANYQITTDELQAHCCAWTPASWRQRSALQQPKYENRAGLKAVEQRLAQRAPVVELNDVDSLSGRLADVAGGRAVLLHGGDCAETFDSLSQENIGALVDLLSQMAVRLERASSRSVIRLARAAGQLAKPRTELMEVVEGRRMPSYRGDAVNSSLPDALLRQPDPERLLHAHKHSAVAARWLCEQVPDGTEPVYTSHEALLLNYEEALTRADELSARWWAGSGHFLWVGNRTRAVSGAHVEYLRGIANPVGVKCGSSIQADELLRLLDIMNPQRQLGKIVIIPRMGHRRIRKILPELMRAISREGWLVPWCLDPMHGNTSLIGGRKTRFVRDIEAEIIDFFEIAAAEGTWPGGIHLELTPDDVTECIGGLVGVEQRDLSLRYTSACDPRLNRDQALEIADVVAAQYERLRSFKVSE
jgi:3-deoxy-7-phosphoheptulonate synthase